MIRAEAERLKIGDIVVLNRHTGVNAGIKCEVTYVCNNPQDETIVAWVKPLPGERLFSVFGTPCDWQEYSYQNFYFLKGEPL